jgi:hypothetical protein
MRGFDEGPLFPPGPGAWADNMHEARENRTTKQIGKILIINGLNLSSLVKAALGILFK